MTDDLSEAYADNEARILGLCEAQQESDKAWGKKMLVLSALAISSIVMAFVFGFYSWSACVPMFLAAMLFSHSYYNARSRHAWLRRFRDDNLEKALHYREYLKSRMRGF